MNDTKRFDRMLSIVTLIQSGRRWTPKLLARELRITLRTLHRDFAALVRAGIYFKFDRRIDAYRPVRDFYMKPLDLTVDEALALVVLGQHLGGTGQIPFTRPAARAVAKVRCQLPETIRRDLEVIDDKLTICLPHATADEESKDVYEKVRHAISFRHVIRCKYEAVHSREPQSSSNWFEFHPYSLFFCQRAWYVIGHHVARRDTRSLKLSRFTALELTKCPFILPKTFSMDRFLGNAWRMIRGKERHEVELEFDAEFGESIAETRWHKTQDVQEHSDGSVRFTCTVDGLDEIVWWILSMGPHCIVRKPALLRRRVREMALAVARNHAASFDGERPLSVQMANTR